MAIFDLSKLDINDIKQLNRRVVLNEDMSFLEKSQLLQEATIGLFNRLLKPNEVIYGKGVFISHRRTYKDKAGEIAKLLDKKKYDTYLDRNDIILNYLTKVSNNVDKDIIKQFLYYGIDKSKYFICLLSYDINLSDWVKNEVEYAKTKNKEMFKYNIDAANLPDFCDYNLEDISYIEDWIKYTLR